MKIILQIFVISLLFFSCIDKKSKDIDSQERIIYKNFRFKTPVIIDTLSSDCYNKNQIWLEDGEYVPIYIGPSLDTIYNAHDIKIDNYFFYDNYEGEHEHFMCLDSAELMFTIDTNIIISDKITIYKCETKEFTEICYNAHPVYIANKTNDTIDIGYGDYIPIFMEAKDTNGNWKQIEEQYMYMCGTGLNGIFLPPGEIMVTSAPIYEGGFKTKLRLRYYYGMCSQEFNGSINMSQFESKWDENGEMKSLPK